MRAAGMTAVDFASRVRPELRSGLLASLQFDLENALATTEGIRRLREELLRGREQSLALRTDSRMEPSDVDVRSERGMPRLRVYGDQGRIGQPCLLWFHGGGHVLGAPEDDDRFCGLVAEQLDCLVVAPAYRLAPENPYPSDVEDGYRAFRWLLQRRNNVAVDPRRIVVGGRSAGGGIAAALTLMLRDQPLGHQPSGQVLIYPMLDCRAATDSTQQFATGPAWNARVNQAAWSIYLPDDQRASPPSYASPACAPVLANLPPAYLQVGDLDLFRDETLEYAIRLAGSNVSVSLAMYSGVYHGADNLCPDSNFAKEMIDDRLSALEGLFRA